MVGVATDSTVGLAWTASLGALEYNVYSCSDELCSNGALLGTTSNTSTSITGVIPDSTYTYFVSPKNSFGFGTLSVVSVSTLSDATAPVITLTGSATVTHVLGATYTDAGATATDAVDGDLSVTASGTVDVNVIGTYTITYSVSDAASNAATQVTRAVNVVDIATIDSDDDGIVDISDTYPLIAIGSLTDTDSDGASDSCDEPCLALGMAADTDDDNDGARREYQL